MRIGIIGTGSMGGMLTRAFARSTLAHVDIVAYNRTPKKLDLLIQQYPVVQKMDSAETLAKTSQVLFLCVKAGDVQPVLDSINSHLQKDQVLISINSTWSIEQLEQAAPCKIVKMIPSITQEALSGTILTMFGTRLDTDDRIIIESLLHSISIPVQIEEEQTRVSSDLTSCGPAFFSLILKSLAQAAEKQGLAEKHADQLVKNMIYGLGKLLVEEGLSFDEVIRRVAVPGGVTAEGLKVLEPALAGVFDRVLLATKQKQAEHESTR